LISERLYFTLFQSFSVVDVMNVEDYQISAAMRVTKGKFCHGLYKYVGVCLIVDILIISMFALTN